MKSHASMKCTPTTDKKHTGKTKQSLSKRCSGAAQLAKPALKHGKELFCHHIHGPLQG